MVYLIILGDITVGSPPKYDGLLSTWFGLAAGKTWYLARPTVVSIALASCWFLAWQSIQHADVELNSHERLSNNDDLQELCASGMVTSATALDKVTPCCEIESLGACLWSVMSAQQLDLQSNPWSQESNKSSSNFKWSKDGALQAICDRLDCSTHSSRPIKIARVCWQTQAQ